MVRKIDIGDDRIFIIDAEKFKHVMLISESDGIWKTQDYAGNEINAPVITRDSSMDNAVFHAMNIIHPMNYNKGEDKNGNH